MHFHFIFALIILMFLLYPLPSGADNQDKYIKREINPNLYPDLQISGNIYVAGNLADTENTVYIKSIAALKKEGGRCAIAIDYEIFNKGAIDVFNRFYSSIQTYNSVNSSRLIDGIAAGEKKPIETIIWLKPGELTNAVIFIDNHNNVREISENNNTREITLLLSGDCETDLNEPSSDDEEKKGLLKRFEFRVQ